MPDQNFSSDGSSGSGSRLLTIGDELNGYRFAFGRVEGTDDFLGIAGVAPTSNPGASITTGSVSYDGSYSLAHVANTTIRQSGDISLVASFDDASVMGSADGVTVNGSFSGTTLGGTVSAFGVDADLAGVVGEARIVGAFAGDSADAILVGGFLAESTE